MIDLELAIEPRLEEQLGIAPVAWVGTVRPEGTPHMTPVWFYWDGGEFLFFAQPGDQKVKNLRNAPDITLGVPLDPDAGSVAIFHGRARLSENSTAVPFPPEYMAKYRERIAVYGWDPAVMVEQYSIPVRVRPSRYTAW